MQMSGALLLRLFGWIVLLAFSLTSGSAAAPSPSWQGEWEKAVDAAKKEGQVAVYTKAGYDGVFSAFQKKYPEIKVISVAGQAADITNRLIAERRAEKYIADVFSFGVRSTQSLMQIKGLDPIRPLLLLPEVVDESKWYEGHVYTDLEKTYILRYLSVAEQQLGLNTNLIKEQKKSSNPTGISSIRNGRVKSSPAMCEPRDRATATCFFGITTRNWVPLFSKKFSARWIQR